MGSRCWLVVVGMFAAACGPQGEQVCHPREINRCECNPDAGPRGENGRGGYMVCDPTGFYWHDCVCSAPDAP